MAAKINMQNIPARNKAIKRLFKARAGYSIINADLGTAEMYVAAATAGDPFLIRVFREGKDFHAQMAKTCFGLETPIQDIKRLNPDERQASKALSFGILYGASEFRVAAELNSLGVKCTISRAKSLIRNYFTNASVLAEFLNKQEATLRKTGKLLYAQGRIRFIPEVFNRNNKIVEHAVRSGLNTLFQGPSSDIMLMGYTDVLNNYIRGVNRDNPNFINPFTLVHDSLTAEVHNSCSEQYKIEVKKAIQTPRYFMPDIGVPITVDFEESDTWAM